MKTIVIDLGDIDSKFYQKLDFEVKAKSNLNIRENPLTGLEISRTTNVASEKSIRVKYFISGSGKNFNEYSNIEIDINENGEIDLELLKEKNPIFKDIYP